METIILTLLPLLAQVESSNNPNAVGDNGRAIGLYQIWKPYWTDGTDYLKVDWPYSDAKDPQKSAKVVTAYLMRYGKDYERRTGQKATWEVLAMIHTSGPEGWKKSHKYHKKALRYVEKIKTIRTIEKE